DFFEAGVAINVAETKFRGMVLSESRAHKPDLIILDNLSHLVAADYSDPKKIDMVFKLCYQLARDNNAAVIVPAHPRKEDLNNPINMVKDPNAFFESIMGSSHCINSMGSLWG